MTAVQRTSQVSRDAILKLLSDEEVARVSTAETAAALSDGHDYIDLENLSSGVQRANTRTKAVMGHVLPRNAVHSGTWAKILGLLATPGK
jgi:hypothetical protein